MHVLFSKSKKKKKKYSVNINQNIDLYSLSGSAVARRVGWPQFPHLKIDEHTPSWPCGAGTGLKLMCANRRAQARAAEGSR